MQVNTRWLPFLARSWRMTPREVASRLINDPCFNVTAAGAIMRIYLDESHGNVVEAVGYYHSHTPELASWYQIRVIRASFVLFGRPAPERPTPRRRIARAGTRSG
jgi:hypothetical protein